MKFDDIIALAKQGYKPADIKELIAIEVPAEEPEKEEPEENKEPEQQEPEADPEPQPDYKALYEESQKKLKAAQAANTKQNIEGKSNQKSDNDLFSDFVQSFM